MRITNLPKLPTSVGVTEKLHESLFISKGVSTFCVVQANRFIRNSTTASTSSHFEVVSHRLSRLRLSNQSASSRSWEQQISGFNTPSSEKRILDQMFRELQNYTLKDTFYIAGPSDKFKTILIAYK